MKATDISVTFGNPLFPGEAGSGQSASGGDGLFFLHLEGRATATGDNNVGVLTKPTVGLDVVDLGTNTNCMLVLSTITATPRFSKTWSSSVFWSKASSTGNRAATTANRHTQGLFFAFNLVAEEFGDLVWHPVRVIAGSVASAKWIYRVPTSPLVFDDTAGVDDPSPSTAPELLASSSSPGASSWRRALCGSNSTPADLSDPCGTSAAQRWLVYQGICRGLVCSWLNLTRCAARSF